MRWRGWHCDGIAYPYPYGYTVVVLLAGGDKSTQEADIKRARKLAKEI